MHAKEALAHQTANNRLVLTKKKTNIFKRKPGVIKKCLHSLKRLLPTRWFDGFLEDLIIDFKELK